MSQERINKALETRVNAWALAQVPPIPIAWPNVQFTPPTTRYARAFIMPAATDSQDLQGLHRGYLGMLQVSLYMPLQQGPKGAITLADSLDAAFSLTTPILVDGLRVYITRPMASGPAMELDSRYMVPVSCRYAANTI
jgi:hypothetical protein